MKTIKIVLHSLIIVLISVSCEKKSGENTLVQSILPPAESLSKAPEKRSIENPQDATTLILPSGTVIQIPGAAFVDSKGERITEKVEIQFTEYKDAADILGSGIPMEYDSAGMEQILQTAGMFEMYGFNTAGEPVFIHPDKKINVKMLSNAIEPNYNFYAFDSTQNNWTYVDKSYTSISTKENMPTDKLPTPPIEPQKYDPNKIVLDMSISTVEFPELNALKGLMWQYAGTKKEEDPKVNNWIFSYKWSDVKLTLLDAEASTFTLSLSDSKKSFSTIVVPVLSGKGYDKAMKSYQSKFKAYSALYADRIAKQKEIENNNQLFYRTVGIGNFGIYNHDRIFNNNSPRITVNFELENGEELEDATIYHLYGSAATVVRYPANKWNSFAFTKTGGNCLVAFLKNGKVATFTNQDFQKLDDSKIKSDKAYTFKMNSASGIDAEAIRKMIKI